MTYSQICPVIQVIAVFLGIHVFSVDYISAAFFVLYGTFTVQDIEAEGYSIIILYSSILDLHV